MVDQNNLPSPAYISGKQWKWEVGPVRTSWHLGYTSTKYTPANTVISDKEIHLAQAAPVCSDTLCVQPYFTDQFSNLSLETTIETWLFSHDRHFKI